jgi:Mce-associated membrane protein
MTDTPRTGRPARRRIAGQRRRPADTPGTTPAPAVDRSAEDTRVEVPAPAVDATVEAPAPAEGGRAGVQRLLAGVLGLLVVLTLAGGLFLGQKAWQGRNAEQARAGASAAARTAAELVLSYDYRQLDKSFAAARATLSSDFADDFDQTAKVVGEQATKTKATVRAEVREVAVRDGDADRVTLLVFVNQTTTSTLTQGKPRIDLNRARFTMIRSGDTWQVQQIEGL